MLYYKNNNKGVNILRTFSLFQFIVKFRSKSILKISANIHVQELNVEIQIHFKEFIYK